MIFLLSLLLQVASPHATMKNVRIIQITERIVLVTKV
ncbi:MAG: hypothetical protein PWQ17_949 [Anaerophaga sp.]|nr:hypothetical protein [Anaerophaga sp.]